MQITEKPIMTTAAAATSHSGENRHLGDWALRAIMFKQKDSISIILCNTETAIFSHARDVARPDFVDFPAAVNAG
ncbi:MAG: hypothetical protein ABWY10_13420 [Tardiphaga sp.]